MENLTNSVLCAASAYEQKYYLGQKFTKLPGQIKEELQIMCVLFTEDVGGVLILSFNEAGHLELKTRHQEDDLHYDEIGSVLKIKELQKNKVDLFASLERYYQAFVQ